MTKFELPEKPNKTNTSEDFNNLRKAVDELDKFDYAWKTYANKADRRINTANKHIEELERENQRLVAENLAIKTLVDNAKPQQALPVVPEDVAKLPPFDDMKEYVLDDRLLTIREYLNKLDDKSNSDITEAEAWCLIHEDIAYRAMLDGYTVEKQQLFYLKHIDMSKKYNSQAQVIAFGHDDGIIDGHAVVPAETFPNDSKYKFTQAEIDSMQTGSYEQIEVTE